jgi:myo-inositol-1(or 4)-monophosphatase
MEKVKQIALQAAKEAGAIQMAHLGNIKNIDYKSAFNIVTNVDKASEAKIIELIKDNFPDDQILAEESGAKTGNTKRRWLIDPLDGTTNYTHSYPFFSVSIGIEENGQMVFAVVFNPFSNELFWAELGKGAFLNDKPIHVSSTNSIEKSLLATGFPPDTKNILGNNMIQFSTLTDLCHGVRRDGSAALDLCFVASGRLDGYWEIKLAPWDIAAGSLIIEEAGGKITNLEGGPLDMNKGHILASNTLIHEQILSAIQLKGSAV